MPKKILIVESDANLIRSIREELSSRGFEVEDSTDGKGAQELIRRSRPDLVVLAVDLAAGQNGYIICGKLKKDDELKAIPVVIVGNPDGFAQHKKLKTHADEYVPKPLNHEELVERIGGLIGMPEASVTQDEEAGVDIDTSDSADESLSLTDMLDEDSGKHAAEEIAVEPPESTAAGVDPELDMLDEAFEDMSAAPPAPSDDEEAVELAEVHEDEDSFDEEPKTQVAPLHSLSAAPPPPPPAAAPPRPVTTLRAAPPPPAGSDAGELRELRSKLNQLQSKLSAAESRNGEHEERIQQLEQDLEAKTSELETTKTAAPAAASKEKDYFALKEKSVKQDKEILRLKSELHEKETQLVDLQEKETGLEQEASQASAEIAKRDAQIKTLTQKTEQLTAEKRKNEPALNAAREEARNATSRLTELESELESLRASVSEVDDAKQQLAESRSQLEAAQAELESARTQLSSQTEETEGLRKKIAELEAASVKHEERVTKLYGRIKQDEKLREKTKKALSIALQLLDEQASGDSLTDEEAAA
jgi:CheY-like chemotaxis protein